MDALTLNCLSGHYQELGENQRKLLAKGKVMRLTFLGKETQGGGSPTLFATDGGTYVVQGWKVAGQPSDTIEIPQRLLAHLEPHTYLGAALSDTGRGTFMLSGELVTDAEALSQMDIPGHESCVEVPKHKEVWFGEPATG